uniref:ribonuclease H n=1 Tax=Haemonchus contortus TaxID=6289 RepID=A0A7I4YRZ1_HAECO
MWRVAGLNGIGLQRLATLRLTHLATSRQGSTRLLPPRILYTDTNKYSSSSGLFFLTSPKRSLAGRSTISDSSPPHSYNSSTFSSPRTGSRNVSNIATGPISSFYNTDESIPSAGVRHLSSGCSINDRRSQSENSRYLSSGGTRPFRWQSADTRSIRSSNEAFASSKSDFSSSCEDPEFSDYLPSPSYQRQSRWDNYYGAQRRSPAPFVSGSGNRATSVSIEHRGDPTLVQNDKEFEALKRDKSAQQEWNKRFPEGTIVNVADLCRQFEAIKLAHSSVGLVQKPPRCRKPRKKRRPIKVYTDGSCIDNRASGFGVYFGPNHELNRSERIIGPIHNSGLAEILGAQMALRSLRNWKGYNNEPVILRTDFLPLVRAMSGGTSDGRFAKEMETVRKLAMNYPKGVQFEHVYAHDGDPGNEQADALARIATADARRARSASAPQRYGTASWDRRSRSRSRERRSRSRERNSNWIRNRSKSRNNDRQHVRSHSAFVAGRRH